MKLVLMSPAMNLGWVMMSLNTWIVVVDTCGERGGGRRGREKEGRHMEGGAEKWRIVLGGTEGDLTFDEVVVKCF